MAKLLQEIEWEAPLVPVESSDYQAQLMEKLSPWLRKSAQAVNGPVVFSYADPKLIGISQLVTSQENACRYCYGVERAVMKFWGYSEKQIRDLEEEASLADGITRQVVTFARKLAKSNPTPAKKDWDALLAEGLHQQAISEIAAFVGDSCFANRMATFLALPPNTTVENLSNGFLGRLLVSVFKKKTLARKVPPPVDFRNEGPCAGIIEVAGNTHLAVRLRETTDGWLASEVIPSRTKVLMMAVIARQLGARYCEEETLRFLADEGLPGKDVAEILAALSSPLLSDIEERLLRWTRDTVWYEPRAIQKSTRRLCADVGERLTLEAIGTAAIANTLARLSLVRE
jgi:alkylhydroperoxidase family enzyme